MTFAARRFSYRLRGRTKFTGRRCWPTNWPAVTPRLEVLDVGKRRRARCPNLTPEGNTIARLAGHSFGTVFNRNGQIYVRVYWAN